MKARRAFVVLASFAALGACNGWPKAAPYSQAEDHPEKYPTYTPAPAQHEAIVFEGRHWMISAAPAVELRGARLQPVGNGELAGLFAESTQTSPYPVLFAPEGTRWRTVLPLD